MCALFGSFLGGDFYDYYSSAGCELSARGSCYGDDESTYHQESMTALTNHEGIVKINLHPNEYDIFIGGKLLKRGYLGVVGNTILC